MRSITLRSVSGSPERAFPTSPAGPRDRTTANAKVSTRPYCPPMSQAPDPDAPQNRAPDQAATSPAEPSQATAPGPAPAPTQDASKPTEQWVPGDEPMTGPQHSYLQTLAREAGRDLPEQMTKAEASDLIEELQASTDRGRSSGA